MIEASLRQQHGERYNVTHKLYFNNPLTFEFEADIVQLETPSDDRTHVVLDKTYFYPTGGGQAHDTGWLNGKPVVDVMQQGAEVVHVVQGLIEGNSVQGRIDSDRRWRAMQAHTGQHVLSAAFVHALGDDAQTLSVSMYPHKASTVDIGLAELSDIQIERVETLVNEVVFDDRPVKSYFVTPDRVPDTLRRGVSDKVSGDVRIVEVDDFDMVACAGTHVPRTGMLGLLKILKVENHKDGSRVHFVAGHLALETFQQYQTVVDDLAREMTTGLEQLPENVRRLQEERNLLAKTVEDQREDLLSFERDRLLSEAESAGDVRVVKAVFTGRDSDDLKLLGLLLANVSGVVALLVNQQGDDATVAVSAAEDSEIHAGNVLRAHLAQFDGHGGGNSRYAQGICKGLLADDAGDTLTDFLQQFNQQVAD
jgi:alanyl-tRNA synthetase